MVGNSPSDPVAVTDKKFAERLRRQANDGHGWDKAPGMLLEAAERIDRLRSELSSKKGAHKCLRCGATAEWLE